MRKCRNKYIKTMRLIAVLGLFAIIVFFIRFSLQPPMDAFMQNAAANAAVVQINDTIYEYLQFNEIDYDDIAQLQLDENGHISAISIQSEQLNKIKTGVTAGVAGKFSQLQSVTLQLPVGSLFGNGLLAGKGFALPINVTFTATAQAELKNMFITRGINQTQHRIVLEIAADVKTFSCGREYLMPITTQVTIAETVIVGIIPEIYAGADDELWPNLVE